jgi:heme-degrading monooxygenase HmoA
VTCSRPRNGLRRLVPVPRGPEQRDPSYNGPGSLPWQPRGYREWVSIIKINAITVPADSGDELARRFAARAGAVDDQPGFEGFELLKPADDRTTWLVVTRWKDEQSFQAWVSSPSFAHGHRSAAERSGGTAPKPVGVHSEVWSYEIAGGSGKP